MNIKLALNLLRNMGWRYFLYRARFEFEKRLSLLRRKHPENPPSKYFLSLDEWKKLKINFLIPERELLNIPKNPSESLASKAKKILDGEVCLFNHDWKNVGKNYNWIANPESGHKYDITKHWSEINDFDKESGDIKYVWEKSRFTYLLTIIRNDYHFDEDHSEFVFNEINNWIDLNPINQGPNWVCSQETSLRIFNWCYAIYFYKNSKFLTENLWTKIQNVIYWSLNHIHSHIDFSRIAVRSNHAITETLMLTLGDLLFPFIPETKQWAEKGRAWFEQEVAYQIYSDGTYLQFSVNYQRVVVQLLSLGIALTEIHRKPFSEIVYERAYKCLDFLYQCLQEENGYLPNYGANDGALFFPLTDSDFRDYRPQLNTLHKILTGNHLYEDTYITEDCEWVMHNKVNNVLHIKKPLIKKQGTVSYPVGGFYLIREQDTFTFIRCGSHNDRPSQADNLHMDVWVKGKNILRDSGSYLYNTDEETTKYFYGTDSHNTVMLDNYDQMLKGPRFIWFYWSQAVSAGFTETDEYFLFKGQINAFKHVHKNIFHTRTIKKYKNKIKWEIIDTVVHNTESPIKQLWNLSRVFSPAYTLHSVDEQGNMIQPLKKDVWFSEFYGFKERSQQISFSSDSNKISTVLESVNH